MLTVIPPRTEQEVGLLVNSELADYQGTVSAPGVEIRNVLAEQGGSESVMIESLKVGDANKRRVPFRGRFFDITLLNAKVMPPKPGNAYPDFSCEILVAKAD